MTDDKIKEEIRAVAEKSLRTGIDVHNPLEDYGADSLDMVEIMCDIEELYDMRFPDDHWITCGMSVADIASLMEELQEAGLFKEGRP
jgi:phosphopantetheine attachment domain protein